MKFQKILDREWDTGCFSEIKKALKANQNINIFMALFCDSCGQRQHILWMSIHLSDTHLGGYYLTKCLVFVLFSHIYTNDLLSQMRTNQGFNHCVLTANTWSSFI